jgi:hypothetical protein
MSLSLKVYRNGEVNVSVRRKVRIQPSETANCSIDPNNFYSAALQVHGFDVALAHKRGNQVGAVESKTLGLSTVSYCSKPKRGLKGISRHARRVLECGAIAIEDKTRIDCLSFLTLTYPDECFTAEPKSSSDSDLRVALNRTRMEFLRELQRRLSQAKLNSFVVGCVEMHPKRESTVGGLLPHIHLCFPGRKHGCPWVLTSSELSALWENCCRRRLKLDESVSFAAAVNVQRVKKSVARYLSKYMSKGRRDSATNSTDVPTQFHPGSWHIISRPLLKCVQQSTRTAVGSMAEWLWDMVKSAPKALVLYWNDVHIEREDGSKFWVGGYSRVTDYLLFASYCGCD